ncbi:type IV secretory system conjugative DNA transfer family protein [Cysteiniphilum marinum]|uniref:type IV secretory system conjugative DNA transfer family protein n=1 Tax=Cysteiniphilum marinum TaxID=2774191 RepID=UPI00193B8969|nr:type IV secretory system conjugative DNA transfer family protein [Cysteiniphilum marinum]
MNTIDKRYIIWNGAVGWSLLFMPLSFLVGCFMALLIPTSASSIYFFAAKLAGYSFLSSRAVWLCYLLMAAALFFFYSARLVCFTSDKKEAHYSATVQTVARLYMLLIVPFYFVAFSGLAANLIYQYFLILDHSNMVNTMLSFIASHPDYRYMTSLYWGYYFLVPMLIFPLLEIVYQAYIRIKYGEVPEEIGEYDPEGVKRHTKDYSEFITNYIKPNYLFHGLDHNDQPIYTDFKKSLDGHYTIMGGTGFGKGVLTRVYLYQSIHADVTNIIFDPKPDEYMYNACCDFSFSAGKKVYVVDLDSPKAQISIFKGINAECFRNIFMSALELGKQKQTNARVYARESEFHLHRISKEVYKEGMTAQEFYAAYTEASDLHSKDLDDLFYYLADCGLFNTHKGVDIEKVIESGHTLFIRCASAKSNPVSREIAQIVFAAVFEHINKRNKNTAKQCVVVIDEFKFVMNTAIMNNLATIREQKCSLWFNFQDTSNFMTSPNEALKNPDYARELISNSHFVAVHNVNEPQTIRLIQERVGKKLYKRLNEKEKSADNDKEDKRWARHAEYKLTSNEIATGEKNTALLLSSLFKDGFNRTHTSIIKTPDYPFSVGIKKKPQ